MYAVNGSKESVNTWTGRCGLLILFTTAKYFVYMFARISYESCVVVFVEKKNMRCLKAR